MKKVIVTISIIIIISMLSVVVFATTGSVNTENLNFRDNASTSSNIIGSLSKGTKVEIEGEEGNWYKASYNGKTGYLSKDYVDKVENTTSNTATVSTDINVEFTKSKLLNETQLYVLPLINSTKLAKLPKDQTVLIISRNGEWINVSSETQHGWVIASNVETPKTTKVKSETNTNEVSQNTTKANDVSENVVKNTVSENTTTENTSKENTVKEETGDSTYPKTMYVKADSLNVRSKASISSEAISGLKEGQAVKVTGKEGDWYKVSTEDGNGYVMAKYLTDNK